MENYFRGMAHIFISGGWIKESFNAILNKEKISLADLLNMNKDNFTLEEIIAANYSFQNLYLINNFYSKMLNCHDFISEVSEYEVPITKKR